MAREYFKLNELKKIKDDKEREDKVKDLFDKEGLKRRLFVGRNTGNDTGLFLYDINGKPKLKIYVDKEGNARLEMIDSNGKTKSLIATN